MKPTYHLYKNVYYPYKAIQDKKYVALYGIFRKDLRTGEIQGYTEHSFHMSFSAERVRLWSLSDAQYFIKKDFTDRDDKNYKYFIYRLTKRGDNDSIVADFKERKECYLSRGLKKFEFRNVKFYRRAV